MTVLVGIYAAIWVTNLGGYADEQRRSDIRFMVRYSISSMSADPKLGMSIAEREEMIEQAVSTAFAGADLDKPFAIRSLRYFRDAFTLRLGEARFMRSTGRGSTLVLDILMAKAPLTLLLFGTANLLTFFGGLFIALALSRRYGRLVDRVVTLLIPVFAAPPWFHGLFLIAIFASFAKILPFGGLVDIPIPETSIGYALSVLKHMILPVSACLLGTLPFAIYANRSLFLIHSTDDYVELARAKGVPEKRLRLRYILRPILPTVITNFALVSLVAWQGVVITEHVFSWPGLGTLLIESVKTFDTPVTIGAITLFAYLLGLNVLLLDFSYMLVDPRVALGMGGRS